MNRLSRRILPTLLCLPLLCPGAEPVTSPRHPGPATLTAEALVRAESDEVHLRVRVVSTDKTLFTALRVNESARGTLVDALVKTGIPSEQIRPDRFATDTQRTPPSEKNKSATVSSDVGLRLTSEAQVQAAVQVIETRTDCTLLELVPADSLRIEHEREALEKALAELARQRALVEKGLGVVLRPREFTREDNVSLLRGAMPQISVKGSGSSLSYLEKAPAAVSTSEPNAWMYRAEVRLTYDLLAPAAP